MLGPLLFPIFINDLTESITSSVKLYADDCLVHRTIPSSNDAIQLQEDHVQLELWVNSWQMTLNAHKCPIMHISNKHNTVSIKYRINGYPLICISGVKYLGVSISSKMSWSDHINDIKTKRHLAMRVQEHLSGKSGKPAIHEHTSSCKDCHPCSISNFYIISQANTDFEAKKEDLYTKKTYTKIKQPNISLGFFIFVKDFFKACIVFIKSNYICYFFITVLDVNKLRCKHLKRKM